jgi:prepilin-type N-terminal cleavage/methylation domain-containing protein
MRPDTRPSHAAFTLIELLVVITVISILVGITILALGTARESSRRVKCLTNLRGIGSGLQVYLNDRKGFLPRVRPLHAGTGPYEPGGSNDPSLLDLLADYIDAPTPRRGDDGFFIVTDPYRCPSDRASNDEGQSFEPLWRSDGVSYEYIAGEFMLFAEMMTVRQPAFGVTKAYEKDRAWPILVDAGDWHKLRQDGPPRNALFYPDMRADWTINLGPSELGPFFEDVVRYGGRMGP